MDRVRTALVGCGKVGQIHAQALSHLPESELVGVCDVDPARASAFAARYGGRSYTEVATVLLLVGGDLPHPVRERLDAVVLGEGSPEGGGAPQDLRRVESGALHAVQLAREVERVLVEALLALVRLAEGSGDRLLPATDPRRVQPVDLPLQMPGVPVRGPVRGARQQPRLVRRCAGRGTPQGDLPAYRSTAAGASLRCRTCSARSATRRGRPGRGPRSGRPVVRWGCLVPRAADRGRRPQTLR